MSKCQILNDSKTYFGEGVVGAEISHLVQEKHLKFHPFFLVFFQQFVEIFLATQDDPDVRQQVHVQGVQDLMLHLQMLNVDGRLGGEDRAVEIVQSSQLGIGPNESVQKRLKEKEEMFFFSFSVSINVQFSNRPDILILHLPQ